MQFLKEYFKEKSDKIEDTKELKMIEDMFDSQIKKYKQRISYKASNLVYILNHPYTSEKGQSVIKFQITWGPETEEKYHSEIELFYNTINAHVKSIEEAMHRKYNYNIRLNFTNDSTTTTTRQKDGSLTISYACYLYNTICMKNYMATLAK
jgi:hypothetical protein